MPSVLDAGAFVSGERPATKRDLKLALRSSPGSVFFDVRDTDCGFWGDSLPDDVVLIITGPTRETRKWFGCVVRKDGKARLT